MKDYLDAVAIVGTILIFTPIIIAIPLILYAILSGKGISIEDGGSAISASMMMTSGLIMIVYVSIKRFFRG